MKHIVRATFFALAILSLTLAGCSEDTGLLGVYQAQNEITNSHGTVGVLSSDTLNAIVPANSTVCYLGKVVDPETDKTDTASFAAQFHTFENYRFPARNAIVAHDGMLCDSIDIRIFIKSSFGDKNNPMKLSVYPLSKTKLMEESMTYYTNTDLKKEFVDNDATPIATKVFTTTDYILSDDQRESGNYTEHIRIVLPRQYGNDIMEAFYSHPEYFRDSYSFIRNVCPGFYFCITSGSGTMLSLSVTTINLSYSYRDEAHPDSIIDGFSRFSATPEVIQSTRFGNGDLSSLINKEDAYTMLKTPAGICTELTLPVNEIYRGHENDSISLASLSLSRYNNRQPTSGYELDVPNSVLLVRKKRMDSFFKNHEVSDNQQSFTTSFQSTYNCYTFANLARLISYIRQEKEAGMKAEGLSAEEWEKKNPDWNKVIIVPVVVSSTTDSYGNTKQVSVNQDLSLSSVKLRRGTKANPIDMQVIYSRYAGS